MNRTPQLDVLKGDIYRLVAALVLKDDIYRLVVALVEPDSPC